MKSILAIVVSAVLVSLAAAFSIQAPAQGSTIQAGSTVTITYGVTNALSSGTAFVYTYIEPNHIELPQCNSARPYTGGLTVNCQFVVPQYTFPNNSQIAIVFEDVNSYGVPKYILSDYYSLQLQVVN